jgi:hypothetical protein
MSPCAVGSGGGGATGCCIIPANAGLDKAVSNTKMLIVFLMFSSMQLSLHLLEGQASHEFNRP